jgi:hypothetical protein
MHISDALPRCSFYAWSGWALFGSFMVYESGLVLVLKMEFWANLAGNSIGVKQVDFLARRQL